MRYEPSQSGNRAVKAFQLLGARDLHDARRLAKKELRPWRSHDGWRLLLAHLFNRVGSTLFFDDDPEQLMQAFDDNERRLITLRQLAACIVLLGRERIAVPLPV